MSDNTSDNTADNSTPHPSPIAHRFGTDDPDAVHAARLRAVQDTAYLRAAWLAAATANDTRITGQKWQWAVFANGIDDDLSQARRDAERDGLTTDDIARAEHLGSNGTPWATQPAHRLLGRLEQLCVQLNISQQLAHAHHTHATEQTQQLATTHTTIEELREDLARADNTIHDLTAADVDHHWETGNRQHHRDPAPRWPQQLRNAHTDIAAATVRDLIDGPNQRADPARRGDGSGIGDAVDTALPDTSGAGDGTWSANPEQLPTATPEREIGPGPEPGAQL
ncbi:hypothetical protein [Nocardia mexicana]|uniref:Uncharacterized protein n=1 Tax=Nocardia mexicana TaxID=279262 RepID=A0A370GJY3_9NOCA|nr:hypothetical protein [Nocardia mexicana]RDI43569.1 hypothetical protein DFR68_12036 [Nocardia mexicana]